MPSHCPHCGQIHSTTARFCSISGKPILEAPIRPASPVGSSYYQLHGQTGMLPANAYLHGRYIIHCRVGKGGMAAVYRATDTRTTAVMAIKEMSDSASAATPADHAYALQCFNQEARLLATLQHINLPRVTDFFEENKRHYLVMEFVEGETLEKLLVSRGRAFSEAEVVPLAIQLCDVLSYLHGLNPPVIFRDLKPANIMVTPAGQVKLIDFGIARFFKAGQAHDTQSLGTYGYVAPEVLGGQQSETRSDIYSLCATLLQLLTGIDPGDYIGRDLPAARTLNPAVSVEMERLLQRGLQREKHLRFSNAAELQAHLYRLPAASVGGAGAGPLVKHTSRPTTRLILAAVQLSSRQLAAALTGIILTIVAAAWILTPVMRRMPIDWNLFPIFAVFGPLGFAAYPKRGMAILAHGILTATLLLTISARLGDGFSLEATALAILASGIFLEGWLFFLPKIKGQGGQDAWRRELAWYASMGAPAVLLFYYLLARGLIGMNPLAWIFGAGFSGLGWFLGDLVNQWLLYRQTGSRRVP